jgi:hypothetical protein
LTTGRPRHLPLAIGAQSLERFAASTTEIIEEPQALLADNADRWQLSDELQENILKRLGYETRDQQRTRYGLVTRRVRLQSLNFAACSRIVPIHMLVA